MPCHHLAFEQATIDWQLWIDAGKDPLPRKLVITYKTEDEVPQVHGDHPEVESRATAAGCAVRLHTPGWCRPCRGTGIRRSRKAAGWRRAMSRHLTTSVTLIALVVGSNPALEAQRSRGSVSHSGNTTSAQGQRASGTRTVNQTSSGGTATRQAQTQSGASRSTTRQVDAENREIDKTTTATTAWGESGDPVPRGRGSRWLRDRRGERAHQHRAFGLRRSRGGPHLLRPAGGRRNGQHEIPRHLQRRRRPHAIWRVQHRGGRARTADV